MYGLLKFNLERKAFRLTFLVYKCISYLKLFNVTVSCFPIEPDTQRRLISNLPCVLDPYRELKPWIFGFVYCSCVLRLEGENLFLLPTVLT